MKKYLAQLTSTVMLASVFLSSVSVGLAAGSFFVDDSGLIGIGNTSPLARLDITGAFYSRLATTSASVNWNQANIQSVTLIGNETLTFTSGHAGGEYKLIVHQDATGGRTVTWPNSVKWPGGTEPVLTTEANGLDLFNFVYDGENYLGTFALNFETPVPPIAETYESYSASSTVNGQSGGTGWSGSWTGDNDFLIATVAPQGSKSMVINVAGGQERTIKRSFGAKTSGTVSWTQRKDAPDHASYVEFLSGTTVVASLGIGSATQPVTGGPDWFVQSGTTTNIIQDYSIGTYDDVAVEFNTSTDQYRVSIDGGAFTTWQNFVNAVSSIDGIRIGISASGNDVGNNYWDDFLIE